MEKSILMCHIGLKQTQNRFGFFFIALNRPSFNSGTSIFELVIWALPKRITKGMGLKPCFYNIKFHDLKVVTIRCFRIIF